MPDDSQQTASLAYRKAKDDIWKGKIPEKYIRLLPYIQGSKVFELGAAEGVLALMLAQRGKRVTAFEKNQDRHSEALKLQQHWAETGLDVAKCTMVLGDILQKPQAIKGHTTFVAIRSIYYLRNKAPEIMSIVGAHCQHAVLCGNPNRAKMYKALKDNQPHAASDNLGEWNYWASVEGMHELLHGAGFYVEEIIRDGDPIMVGRKL